MRKNISQRLKKHLGIKGKRTNLHTILIVVAVVMIRRGTWGILDKILFPNHEIVSYIVSFAIGILILYIDDEKIDELKHH